LTFPQLVQTLDLIEGESVVVMLHAVAPEPAEVQQIASIVGVIRRGATRFADRGVYEFSVGEPYPDTYPGHLAGGILFLKERVFLDAKLKTFDGNDYFVISISTAAFEILVQDGDSGYP
jgi:hypothetical protein